MTENVFEVGQPGKAIDNAIIDIIEGRLPKADTRFGKKEDVPAVKALQQVVDEVNKTDSQSVLDAYKCLNVELKKNVELYTDEDSNLKMRLTKQFVEEAFHKHKVDTYKDALLKHDIRALNKLCPLDMFIINDLIKALEDAGWSVRTSVNPDSVSRYDRVITFVPPGESKAISWVQWHGVGDPMNELADNGEYFKEDER